MELLLNLAWAVVSVGLILLWLRGTATNRASRRTQVMALVVVVLLLLPVISLSDDLMAAQSFAETDTCLRRAHDCDCSHHPVPSFSLPEEIAIALAATGPSQEVSVQESVATPGSFDVEALFSRPPPRA